MLNVDHVSYAYPGNAEDTLKDLSFGMESGEIFGFLGPSGSGKSTTQKLLYKLLPGYHGKVELMGKSLQDWDRSFYRQIGVSFELPNHYLKLTAEENLRFFAAFYDVPPTRIPELLDLVGLLPDAKKPVSDFSKGMKMRLNFVRAILHDPAMLFLDEPTSGLDPINANKIKALIRDLGARGKSIFITTHNMFDADQLCDRVVLLHEGKIMALDTPANLKMAYGSRVLNLTTAGEKGQAYQFPLEGLGSNEAFLSMIREQEISMMHSQEASLEEVFIRITGKELL